MEGSGSGGGADGRVPSRVGHYELRRTIGKGNFATVKLAYHRIAKRKVALKMVEKARMERENLLKVQREIQILKSLSHPHIVKLYEVVEDSERLFMALELVGGGEVFRRLAESGPMGETEARRVFAQTTAAVAYCHSRGVVHRDLKAENIMLDSQGSVRLIDFGFSNLWPSEGSEGLRTWCGSPPYAAPELFRGQAYDGAKADVWSLGVLLFILVSGGFPFPATSMERLKVAVLSGSFSIPFRVSVECSDLIRKMLTVSPAQRFTIRQVAHHRWFAVNDDLPGTDRDTMRASLEAGPQRAPSPAQLSQSVLLFLQQAARWDPTAVADSVLHARHDMYHAAYTLLCDKLAKQAHLSPHSPSLAVRKAAGAPRRGSITQGTASEGSTAFPTIPAADLAKLNISSPDLDAALSSEESDGVEEPPAAVQPSDLQRLAGIFHAAQAGQAAGDPDEDEAMDESTAPAKYNPNRRHTLCETISAGPDQTNQNFLLAAAQITGGLGPPASQLPAQPFPLQTRLLQPVNLASAASPLSHPTHLPFAPPTSAFTGCLQGPSSSAGHSLLNPFQQVAWGRRASDNPGLSADVLAHLQGLASAGAGGSDQPSPSSPAEPGPADDSAELQAYLRGRGAEKRHTIAATNALFSPSSNPFQLPSPPNLLPQQLSPLSRERRRHELGQPSAATVRRASDNPAEALDAAHLAQLQALFAQRLEAEGSAAEMEQLKKDMAALHAHKDGPGLRLGSSSPGSGGGSPSNPPALQLGSIQEVSEARAHHLPALPHPTPNLNLPKISLTDADGEASQFIHQFQAEAARLLPEAGARGGAAEAAEAGDVSSALGTERPVSEVVGDLRLLARQNAFALSETQTGTGQASLSLETSGGDLALEIRLASVGAQTQLQFRRLKGSSADFRNLSHALVTHLHL